MAQGINKVILIGHLGRDPEVRYSQGGKPVASFSLATSEQWNDQQSGERREKTEWHNVVFFNRLAEVAGEYLRKGAKVYIEGKLSTSQYEKEGQTHYRTQIIGSQMQMLDSRNASGQQGGGHQGQGGAPYQGPPQGQGAPQQQMNYGGQQQQQPQQQNQNWGNQQQQAVNYNQQHGGDFEDDIPF